MLRNLIINTLTLFCSISLIAQTTTVRGFIYFDLNGEPAPFVNVFLKENTSLGTTTDINGYFSISKIPTGAYYLQAKSLGYKSVEKNVELTKTDQIFTTKFYLEKDEITLEEFKLEETGQEQRSDIKIGAVSITPIEMELVPSIGGETDLASYIQTLPGVVFTGDQGGQLYIRGGSPVQNLVLLDGMAIYNPFHSIGFFSVFDSDIIRNAEVSTGGFGAEYGGRISSVMDITTKDGNRSKFGGKLSLSPFIAKALLEGPIQKMSRNNNSSSSFLFTIRNSHLDQSSKAIYGPLDNTIDSVGLPFSFTDLYGKISFNGQSGSNASFFGFKNTDKAKWGNGSNLEWDAFGLGSKFVLIPGSSAVLITGNLAYSSYKVGLTEVLKTNEEPLPKESSINGFNFGIDFKYFSGKDEILYGIDISGYQTQFNYFNLLKRKIESEENNTELGLFLKYKFNRDFLVIEPGLRTIYYPSISASTISLEPRLRLKYNASNRLRFQAATGLYSQNILSSSSDRTVVNLFTGFISNPENLSNKLQLQNGETKEVDIPLQKAIHFIAGGSFDISKTVQMKLEGYYKYFPQLVNLNREKIYDDTPENKNVPDVLKKDFIVENGFAKGLDFELKYHKKRINLWGVYSLGQVKRWNGSANYFPAFDRRHTISLTGSVQLGKEVKWGNRSFYLWNLSTRWSLGSGLPFTQTLGVFEKIDFTDGIDTDLKKVNGQLALLYNNINEGRLPYYHRLDISINRVFDLGKTQLEAKLTVSNLYNRANVFYVVRETGERVDQLPILPSLGVNWKF